MLIHINNKDVKQVYYELVKISGKISNYATGLQSDEYPHFSKIMRKVEKKENKMRKNKIDMLASLELEE